MRTLVTGGAGFIGSSIARALVRRGDVVRVLDNFLTGFEENVPDGVELMRGDLRDIDDVRRACGGVEVVFHQGALRSVPRSVDDPLLTEACNVQGTLNVLLAAREGNVRRVVYASSSSVYGGAERPIDSEDLKPDPISPYAVSKLSAEQYCSVWFRMTGLSTVSLRYFNVFGPGQHPESKYSAVFPAFIAALAEGRAPGLHWDGEQSRDFTFIDDVVRANLLAAEAGDAVGGRALNVGAGRAKTVNEVYRAVSRALGVDIEPVRLPRRAGDVRRTLADISLAQGFLGWVPQADWEDAVAQTVEWFRTRTPVGSRP